MSKSAVTKREKPAKRSRRSSGDADLAVRPAATSKSAVKDMKQPKKPKKTAESNDKTETTSRAVTSVLQQEEKAFPRGGASVLTPIERKQIQIQADRDALFEESGSKRKAPADVDEDGEDHHVTEEKPKPRKKRRTKVGSQNDDGEAAAEKVERIEPLSFRKLVPGSLVLGQVSQITSRDIALSLPNNLTGYVPLTSISQRLTASVEKLLEEPDNEEDEEDDEDFQDVDLKNLFHIGQYLRASVVSNTATDNLRAGKHKKHLELSLDPRLTNAGLTQEDLVPNATVQVSVASVEDGGLLVDLCIEGTTAQGFIGANDVGSAAKHSDFEVGAVLLCMVLGQSANGRVIKLTSDRTVIGDVMKSHGLTNAPSIKSFMPGTAATAIISEINPSGIRGTIMGMLDVSADVIHSGGAQGNTDIQKKYRPGSHINVRVLYTCPKDETQRVGVSLVEHVLSLSSKCLNSKKNASPLDQLPMSSIIQEAKVVKVQPRVGIYLNVGIPRVHAFAHISQLSDKQVDSVTEDIGPFKVGSIHKVRVIGYSPIDGLFSVTLKESTISQPFLRLEDVKVGQLVEGEIEDLPIKPEGISGIRLVLAEGIRGFVPVDHIADVKLKHPERKYRKGQKGIKARVLSVNVEKRSIYLTMKKTLVSSEVVPWTKFDNLKVGEQSPGTITKIIPSGATVQFYGDVRAFLPVREMSEAFIKDPAEHFRIGQVVNVRIISVDCDNKRMIVSCKGPESASNEQKAHFDKLAVGQVVSGNIIELGNELISLELDGGVQGHLRVSHLTDGSEKKNTAVLAKLRAGMKMQGLVILQKIEKTRIMRLSNKPSLVKAAQNGNLFTKIEQLKPGKEVHGFVSSITATGVFVELGDNFSGLIPVSGMTDEMRRAKMQDFGVSVGQSMTAHVWNIYPEDNRFTLSLRGEDVTEQPQADAGVLKASRILQHPIDENLKSIEELTIGKQTLARVNAIKDFQLNISLADGVHGRIHVTEMFKTFEDITDPKKPLQSIKHNTVLPVTVTGLHAAKTSKFLPLSHRQSVHPVYECSHKQSGTSEPEILSLLKLKACEERIAFIIKYMPNFAIASISPEISGTINVSNLASIDADYEKAFPAGSALRITVDRVDVDQGKVYLKPVAAAPSKEKTFDVGGIHVGRVARTLAYGINVTLGKKARGFVALTDLTDDYEQAQLEKYKEKDIIKVKILAIQDDGHFVLSARPSLTTSDTTKMEVHDPYIATGSDLKVGKIVRGFVKNLSKAGIIVRLGWNTTAQVPIHELADDFLKTPESAFKQNQLIKGKIIKVDESPDGHHKMSLRASVLANENYKPEVGFGDLELGQVVDAVVVKVENYGVFIKVENSKNVRGLCHVKELASTRVEDPSKLYSEGDRVKAKIIKLDKTKRHVNFSLKAVHFQQEVADGEEVEMEDADEDAAGDEMDLDDVPNLDSDEDDALEEASGVPEEPVQPTNVKTVSRSLKTEGFDWNGGPEDNDDEAIHPDPNTDAPKKRHRKAEIEQDKTGDLDAFGPQKVSDYERLLLGQPNSSALWIQYMAFQLGLNEVEEARKIADRALKTINMTEEEEKVNVWTALLNLETTYGSEETLDTVFERACQMSDKKLVHMRLASIFIDSGKHKEAEELFGRMRKIRDISSDPMYWLKYATFLMTTLNRADDARALLQRATQSLPTHQHANIISRFGALEYQSPQGDIERGRTVFEGLVDAHKNGHDLWDQYLAQEISLEKTGRGDVDAVRQLFERMTKLKMKPKRAKFVFKKWLGWEQELVGEGKGGDKNIARVKALAEEYVENNAVKKAIDV